MVIRSFFMVWMCQNSYGRFIFRNLVASGLLFDSECLNMVDLYVIERVLVE
jgi:hypothetical protein